MSRRPSSVLVPGPRGSGSSAGLDLEEALDGDRSYNAKLGIWLFLVSEAVLFGALVVAYLVLRRGALDWPRPSEFLNLPLGVVNCLVLIASSLTMVAAWATLRTHGLARSRRRLGLTNLLAIAFLAVKGVEYWQKLSHDILASDRTFLSFYFTLTGLHAVHVVAGLAVNLHLWGPGSQLWQSDPRRYCRRLEVAGIYWHFVDLSWLLLFVVLYL